jgi:hypothetical protein
MLAGLCGSTATTGSLALLLGKFLPSRFELALTSRSTTASASTLPESATTMASAKGTAAMSRLMAAPRWGAPR